MMDYSDLIGMPFDEQAMNCYDVLREVYRRNGTIIPKTNISVCASKQASNQEINSHLLLNWREIETPVAPCGVLIQSSHPDFANHIGVYIGRGKMLHTTINRAVVVDRIESWKHKIIGYYQYVGYTD